LAAVKNSDDVDCVFENSIGNGNILPQGKYPDVGTKVVASPAQLRMITQSKATSPYVVNKF
jgi:hypothetical protein